MINDQLACALNRSVANKMIFFSPSLNREENVFRNLNVKNQSNVKSIIFNVCV